MSACIPKSEPAQLRAGETLQFIKSLTDYPATDGWVINYSFRGQSPTKIDFSSTASDKDHSVTVPFATTAEWMPGCYLGTGTVTDGTTAKVIFTGELKILPNLAAMDGGTDTRTPNRIALDNVRAVLAGRATSAILKSEVEGTILERIPHSELIRLESYLATRVRNEEIELLQAQGKPTGRTIFAQFTRPK
jgi:hypothetical protein